MRRRDVDAAVAGFEHVKQLVNALAFADGKLRDRRGTIVGSKHAATDSGRFRKARWHVEVLELITRKKPVLEVAELGDFYFKTGRAGLVIESDEMLEVVLTGEIFKMVDRKINAPAEHENQ